MPTSRSTSEVPERRSMSRGEVRALLALIGGALRTRRGAVLGFAVCQVAAVLTSLAQPALNAAIIDDGMLRGDTETIKLVGLAMLAVAVVNLGVAVGATYLASHISSAAARDLRKRLDERVAAFTDPQVARVGGSVQPAHPLHQRRRADPGLSVHLAHHGGDGSPDAVGRTGAVPRTGLADGAGDCGLRGACWQSSWRCSSGS